MPAPTVLVPAPAPTTRSRGLRQLLPWLLALAVATCTQDNLGPSKGGTGYFAFRPNYQLAGGASLSQFGIVADSVHIRLTRPVDEVVLDTSVAFPADSGELRLALPVVLEASPEVLDAVISISSGGVVIFVDSLQVTVKDGVPDGTPPPVATFDYVGPGSNIGTLVVAPGDTTVVLGDTLFFSALAFDSSAVPVTTFYVGWRTSDTAVAKINAAGRLISPVARGSVQVIGVTPTGIADTTTVTFAPVPVTIYADSGGGQTGVVNDSLPALFVARVMGADSLGISGIPVRFQAVTAGGAVRDTLVYTDAQGRARTRAVLGTNAVSYNFSATALGTGLTPAVFVAGSVSGAASAIAIQGGNAQSDTIGQALALPLAVRVTDAFNNPVAGATVVFAVTSGNGTLGNDTLLTDATGVASVGYTLGGLVGTDSIRADLAGSSAFVVFTATAVNSGPFAITADSGDAQSALPGLPFTDSLVVRVLDFGTNRVPGATVQWSVASGTATLSAATSLTDANGKARIGVTAGATAGPVQVRATVAGLADTAQFALTITPGAASAIAIQGGNAQSDTITKALPLPFTVRVADASDNPVPGAQVLFSIVTGNGALANDTVVTDGSGLASVGYTLGGLVGTDSIRADLLGTSAFVTFTATAVNGGPFALVADSGSGQSAIAGTPFTDSLVVRVLDFGTNPVPGATVQWGVTLGSATLGGASSVTDANGRARIGLTAGGIAGAVNIAATIAGVADTGKFNAQVNPAAAASLIIVSGNGQTASAGAALPLPLVVRALDAFGNRVPGVPVAFGVTAGGGAVDSATATTNGIGEANSGLWTLGAVAGANQVRATSAAVPADTLLFDAISAPAGATKLWTAASTASWKDAASWQPAGVPTLTDSVFIPAGVTAPVVDTAAEAGKLEVQSGGLVQLATGSLTVSGDLLADGGLSGAAPVILAGSGATVRGSILASQVTVTGDRTLAGNVTIGGPLDVQAGILTLGGHALIVDGALDVSGSGQLASSFAADSLDVSGTATWSTGASGAGQLSGGVLVLRGDLVQTPGAADNFHASGTHRTRFAGGVTQTVSFGTPNSGQSAFQEVEFANAAGVTLNSNFAANGLAQVSAGTVTGVGRVALLSGGLTTSYAAWQVSSTNFEVAPFFYPDSLPRNVTVNAAWGLSKSFGVDSTLTITAPSALALGAHSLRVGGDLIQDGRLLMQTAADTVDVGGALVVGSPTSGAGDLIAGMLRLHGGLTQTAGAADNFAPSGTHVTQFAGTGGQTVSFGTPGATQSRFQHLEVADSVLFGTDMATLGTVTLLGGGKVAGSSLAVIGQGLTDPTLLGWRFAQTEMSGTVTALPESLVTDLTISGNWTVAQRTRVAGTVQITATGIVTLGPDTLVADGDVTQGGRLVSTDPAAMLDVGGTFFVTSPFSSSGDLSAGTLFLRRGLQQAAGAADNFLANGTHVTRFGGGATAIQHSTTFATPGIGQSQFGVVEFADSARFLTDFTAAGDVHITGGAAVGTVTATLYGGLTDPGNAGWRVATTVLSGTPGPFPDSIATDVVVNIAWTVAAPTWITGDLTIGTAGVLDLGGHPLRVAGAATQGGRLRMLQPGDTLDVGGAFGVVSPMSGTGDLVDGSLVLRGNFTQTAGAADNFAPATSHTTIFAGTGGHTLSFSSTSLANSRFHHLTVLDSITVATSLSASGNVTLDPAGRIVGPGTGYLAGNLSDPSLLGWRMTATSLEGKFQSIPSALTTNVSLADSIVLGQNTAVTGSWTVQNTGTLVLGGHALTVSADVIQSGILVMQSSQDSIDALDLYVNSPMDGTGHLTAGTIVLHGAFSQTPGAANNFVATAPHRVVFDGSYLTSLWMQNAGTSHFGDVTLARSAPFDLLSDIAISGTLQTAAGPAQALQAAAQQLVTAGGLAVDGLTLDRVRMQLNSPSVNAAQFDNVTFTNIDPALVQLSLEFPGLTGDTIRFNNVAFSGTPTTGLYVFLADSAANDAPATVGFYNSTPLNGAAFVAYEGTVGDVGNVLWSHFEWLTQPSNGVELVGMIPSPQVRAVDPSGTLLAGYTGTVTLGFAVDPSSGAAALANNVVAAVGGVATFDSLSVSLAGAGYQLFAAASGLGQGPASAPFTINVPLPGGTTTAFNNGGGDNDWFNAANWTAGVPDSLDNIFVYPGQTATVNTPASVNDVIVGTGGGIVLNASLTVLGSVSAGNTITGGSQLVAQGTGTLTGQVGDLLVTGSYGVAPGGHLRAQTVVIDGAALLNVLDDSVTVTDSLATKNGGALNINGPQGVVDIGGDARFGGNPSVMLNGSLVLRGGLYTYAPATLQTAPAFQMSFQGTGTQTVFLAAGDSVNALPSIAMTGDTLVFASNVWVAGTADFNTGVTRIDSTLVAMQGASGAPGTELRGNILQVGSDLAFGGTYAVATTNFAGPATTIDALPYDTVYVSGQAQLGANVAANLFYVIGSGQFLMNGHRLDIAGDFGTSQFGQFAMTSPADTLIVGGSFYASGGSTTGLLTDGLLQVSGNFIQGMYTGGIPVEVVPPLPAGDAFNADTGHVTRIVGGALPRLIYFDNPLQPPGSGSIIAGPTSQFGTLELVDGSDSLASVIPVGGNATVTGGALNGAGTLAVIGKLTVGPAVDSVWMTSLYTGGGLDYQAPAGTFGVFETFFFGGDSVPVLPYQWLRVGFAPMALMGDLAVGQVTVGGQGEGIADSYGGEVILNGHALTVSGSFTLTGFGTARMDQVTDSLDVTGNFNGNGGSTTGLLTAGTIVARGGVYLNPNWVDSTFVAGGTHRFVMAAAGLADLWISQGADQAIRFNKFTVLPGTSVAFNPFTTGALIAEDSLYIDGIFAQSAAGKTIISRGPMFVSTGADLTIDTLELHQTVSVGDAGFNVLVTRYAGAGQVLDGSLSYQELEVTGTATVTANTNVTADARVLGGGRLDIGPATLSVLRTFAVLDSADLGMADPLAAISTDTARFAGASTAGDLTAGTLRARALFQSSLRNDSSYAPSGTFLTQIGTPSGGTEYRIQFEDATGASRLQDLLLDDGGQVIVPTRIVGRVPVAGKLRTVPQGSGGIIGDPGAFLAVFDSLIINDAGTPVSLDTLELHGPLAVPTGVLGAGVTRFAGAGQAIPDSQSYQGIEITGTASPEAQTPVVAASVKVLGNGQLTLGAAQKVTTSGDFATGENGTLQMNGAGADLFVGGNVTFAGGSAVGLLSDGTIRVAGNFTQLPGTSNETFTTVGFGTGVTFLGSAGVQQVTIDPAAIGNFRGVGITNPNGINISGLMVVTDSVGTVAPITGDSLWQFGNFNFGGAGSATVNLKVLKTAGLFSGTPATYTVGRTTIVVPNSLPNVVFDTLVINANGVSAFYPLQATTVIVAAAGSPWASGPDGVLDLGAYGGAVNHSITGELRVEGNGAQLRIAEDTVNVSDQLTTALGGTVTMADPNGALFVFGHATFQGGSQIGLLTAGTFQLWGNLTQGPAGSPSSFRMDGTTMDFTTGALHTLSFAAPDSSWLPDLAGSGAASLILQVNGRARVAGGISGYGVSLSGDSLWIDGMLTAGSAPVTASLAELRVGQLDQFGNFSGVGTFVVGTAHITGSGALPFNLDPIFDSLFVHDSVQGQLSQVIATKYLEVTGPGDPRNLTGVPGRFYLIGGDGNTQVNVNGDVVVRGAGAGIINSEGYLQATGSLVVDQGGYLAANGSFGGGNFDIDGDVVFDGASTRDSLVQGSLMIGGKFTQLATTSAESYAPDSLFNTQFKFAGTHTVSFATPSAAGGGGSHFGGLSFSADAGLVMETDTDLWVEGILGTQSFSTPTLRNTGAVLHSLIVRDVAIQGVQFDHLQLRLQKNSAPAASSGNMDGVTFLNFLTSEDQFVVDLPGTSTQYNWGGFTFTPLNTGDSGHYLVATDTDGAIPDVLSISLGTNNWGVTDPPFYIGLNGAIVSPFAP